MNSVSWASSWKGYALDFVAPYGLPEFGSPRIGLTVTVAGEPDTVAATGHFKLRREGFEDEALGRLFDLIILSNIDIIDSHQRQGLGTEIVRLLAAKFPDALIIGEMQNEEAVRWHEGQLEKRFRTRMITLSGADEIRVAAGAEIDPGEV